MRRIVIKKKKYKNLNNEPADSVQEPIEAYHRSDVFHKEISPRTLQILDRSYWQYQNGNFCSFDEYFVKYKK